MELMTRGNAHITKVDQLLTAYNHDQWFAAERATLANEQVTELIEEYYQVNALPREVSCNAAGFAEDFLGVYPEATVISPKEGRLLEQIDLAALNARQGLDAHFMSARLEDDNLALLEELGKLLGLPTPYRIELFDKVVDSLADVARGGIIGALLRADLAELLPHRHHLCYIAAACLQLL